MGPFNMPKLYEYLGILIFFYSNEHEPIHVHAKYGKFESKAEIILEGGEIVEIKISPIKGLYPLSGSELTHFKDFLAVYANEIVKKWIDYFVYHKEIEFERITKRIK
jgi:hypothetical protein